MLSYVMLLLFIVFDLFTCSLPHFIDWCCGPFVTIFLFSVSTCYSISCLFQILVSTCLLCLVSFLCYNLTSFCSQDETCHLQMEDAI